MKRIVRECKEHISRCEVACLFCPSALYIYTLPTEKQTTVFHVYR